LPTDQFSPNPLGHKVSSVGVRRLGYESLKLGFGDSNPALPDLNGPDFVGPDEAPEMRPPDGKAFAGLFDGQ
jgi:hypothetical protein